MCGYGVRGVTGGLVRVLKADDALRGAAPTLAHTLLMGQTIPSLPSTLLSLRKYSGLKLYNLIPYFWMRKN